MKKLTAMIIAAAMVVTGMLAFAPASYQAAEKQRTTRLDLTADTVNGDWTFNPETEDGYHVDQGWSWSYATKTLTLDNVLFSIDEKDIYSQQSVIELPPGSTIVLKGTNIISYYGDDYLFTAKTEYDPVKDIEGDLTISGNGSLTSNCLYGIRASETLTITDAQLDFTNARFALNSYALRLNNCNIRAEEGPERTSYSPLISVDGEYANGGIIFNNCYIKTGKLLTENFDPEYSDYETTYIGLSDEWMPEVTILSGTQSAVTQKPAPKASSEYKNVTLKWSFDPDAAYYTIYRSEKKKGGYKEIFTTDQNTYTDTNLTFNKTYYYKVEAGNQVNALKSAAVQIKTALKKPSVTLKRSKDKRSIKVSWKKVKGAQGYKIYRATKKNGTYRLVKTIKKGGTTSFKNKGLAKKQKYYYKVKAYRKSGKKLIYSAASKVKKK